MFGDCSDAKLSNERVFHTGFDRSVCMSADKWVSFWREKNVCTISDWYIKTERLVRVYTDEQTRRLLYLIGFLMFHSGCYKLRSGYKKLDLEELYAIDKVIYTTLPSTGGISNQIGHWLVEECTKVQICVNTLWILSNIADICFLHNCNASIIINKICRSKQIK